MDRLTAREIQLALIAKGYYPGVVDGIWGRRTVAAVRQFQRSVGLVEDGIVGARTYAELFGKKPPSKQSPFLPWVAEAHHLLGTKEIAGARNNPKILDWADDLDIHYKGDDTPWCGLFVAHCLGATMPSEVLPSNPLAARAWLKFGTPTEPRLGAIMVFWREAKNSSKGHVGFYAGENEVAFRILGGNQSDSVSFAWVSRDRHIGARWPVGAASINGGETVVHIDKDVDLSQNEA